MPHALDNCERDSVLDEWKTYQVDDGIEDNWFIAEKTQSEVKYHRIDSYWAHVFNTKNRDGKCRYSALSKVVKCALVLAHGNADVERGFSLNNFFALVT